MIVFPGSVWNQEKIATTGGIVWEHSILLVKNTMEMLVLLAGSYTDNEFF